MYFKKEVREILGIKKSIFLRICKANEEDMKHFKVNSRIEDIKNLIDFSPNKLSVDDIADTLEMNKYSVIRNLEKLNYMDKIKEIKNLKETTIDYMNKNKNKYSMKEISKNLDIKYGTIVNIVNNNNLKHLLKK